MNTKIGLLSVLLALQLVMVVVALWAPGNPDNAQQQLLVFARDDVNRLVISERGKSLELNKADGKWMVNGVPADAAKLSETLDKLAALQAPWPVATSSSSAQRFEVGAENYQRRIQLFAADEPLADLYLGTSPGYQRVHARRADGDDIYSVALSHYELAVNADDWVDKSLLASNKAPQAIRVEFMGDTPAPAANLEQTEEGWLYNGSAADQTAAQTYANRFTTLRVLGLAQDVQAAETLAHISLKSGEDERVLSVSKLGEGDEYLLEELGAGIKYRLATYTAEQLLMSDADFLPKGDQTAESEENIGAR